MISDGYIKLRAPSPEDISEWTRWFNNLETTKYLRHGVWPVTVEQEDKIIAGEMSDPRSMLFAIIEATGSSAGRLIGCIGLRQIDLLNRTAEIGLVMAPCKRPHDAPLRAMKLLTAHAFNRLNLYKLHAGQHEELEGWVRKLETIGYVREGYQEAMGWRDGKPYGVVMTGITEPRFRQLEKGTKHHV